MKRALLVIDAQDEYFIGALPVTHPHDHLENLLRAMDASAGQVPTVVIQDHFPDPAAGIFQRGSEASRDGDTD